MTIHTLFLLTMMTFPTTGMSLRHIIKTTDFNQQALSGQAMLTVNKPGFYQLGSDIVVQPVNTNVTIIRIATSNVVLDLDNHAISQAPGSFATVNGIEVTDASANVTVRDGMMSDINGTGILVQNQATNVRIADISINSCSYQGISIDSATNVVLSNINVTHCDGSHEDATNGALGIAITNTSIASLNHIVCAANSNQAGDSTGILIDNSDECTLSKVISAGHTGSNAYGFKITGSSTACSLLSCKAINNTATSSLCVGFYMSSAINTDVINCIARSHNTRGSSHVCYGFYSVNGHANKFENCQASSNYAQIVCAGIGITGREQFTRIINSTSEVNSSDVDAYGIMIGTDGNDMQPAHCTVSGNQVYNNAGQRKQYGIRDFSPITTSLYKENSAYGHGRINPGPGNLVLTDAMNYMISFSPSAASNLMFTEEKSEEVNRLQKQDSRENISIY